MRTKESKIRENARVQIQKYTRLGSGLCFKCGKLPYGKNNRTCEKCTEKMKASRKRTIKAHWNNYIWFSVRNGAIKRGIEFNISRDDIPELPELCPLLNIPLEINTGGVKPNSPTIDRIDPSKGYVKGNVWVISHKANTIKSNATIEEIELLAKNLKEKLRQFSSPSHEKGA